MKMAQNQTLLSPLPAGVIARFRLQKSDTFDSGPCFGPAAHPRGNVNLAKADDDYTPSIISLHAIFPRFIQGLACACQIDLQPRVLTKNYPPLKPFINQTVPLYRGRLARLCKGFAWSFGVQHEE
jgi:hypothetical protein